jgi:hypothetical protein
MGELIAATAIEQYGWSTIITPMNHIDILAMKDGVFIRVQVKASTYKLEKSTPTYRFMTSTSSQQYLDTMNIDILAAVALDSRRVIFYNIDDLTKTLRIHPDKFNIVDIERSSWETAVNKVLGL